MKLPIPEESLSQHAVVLGKTGAGKSSALRVLVEHLLKKSKRVVVVDPKGDWSGLKVSADGKAPGFPVILFGDFKQEEARHIPITEKMGKQVAELVTSGNRPCVIGFRGWTQGAMTRFWIDFAQGIFNANSGELYLVGDEFHNFAPKGKIISPEAGMCLHWSNRLLSEGRGLGLICLIASQRPQKVHNDTLTSCETLIAMRVVHAADRNAVKDWIQGCGDGKHGQEVLDSLAGLQRGEAYVWSPEIGFGPKLVKFPMFSTYDSFAPPQVQKKIARAGWEGVDLKEVEQQFAASIEEAKANDPKELKKQLADAKKQLSDALRMASNPPVVQDTKALEKAREANVSLGDAVESLSRQLESSRASNNTSADALRNLVGMLRQSIEDALRDFDTEAQSIIDILRKESSVPVPPVPKRPAKVIAVTPPSTVTVKSYETQHKQPLKSLTTEHTWTVPASTEPESRAALNNIERKIIDAAATMEAIGLPPDRTQLASLSGYHPRAKSFVNSLGALRSKGLFSGDGLTENGRRCAEWPQHDPTEESVHEMIKERMLRQPLERRIFDTIAQSGGSIAKEELATALNYHPRAKSFVNGLGRLSGLGLVRHRDGTVRGTRAMYPITGDK